MWSRTGQQVITIHILPNVSTSKDNQAMKYDQLIEYNGEMIFLKNHAENEAGRLVPDLFLFFKKALYKLKASGQPLNFNMYWKIST